MATPKEPVHKKISEMTADESRGLMKPVGVPGLPYPMAMLRKTDKGIMEHDVGVVESAQNPLLIPSTQSVERVNGMLFRQMPIPAMMFMLRDLLKKIEPDSKNRIMTVFGDAAFGKSHLFKLVGGIVHPQGPISVDCGGMNMREIFFRTVIDYGQGVKEQLDKRAANGQLSETSLKALEEGFKGSVVTAADGTTTINWDAIGAPRQETTGDKTGNVEDRGDAAERAKKLLESIYAKEGINYQTNAFGIKTVPGEWFESVWSGRPLFLDEFNKSKKGTLDAFQTALQFANGEIDEVTIYNPMAASGDSDSPKALTIKRSDLRAGWHIGVAGNDASDGDTTQELSVSMMTRLNPLRVGEPALRDWTHRIGQVWTGLPVVTLYNLFEGTAKAKPAEFGEWLVKLRKEGLSAEEVKAIPPHEIYFLSNFQETVQAVNQVARYYDTRLRLSNPESELYNQKVYQDMSDEVAAHGDRLHVSFRKVIADFNKAVQAMPEVRNAKEASLTLDLSSVFKAIDLSAVGRTLPGWHRFGANMVRAVQEDIANDTLGMPRSNAALVTICETNGIGSAKLAEGRASKEVKLLADLLKYDELKDLGGTEELMEVRNVLMAGLRSKHKNIQSNDDQVIPLKTLGRVLKEMADQKEPSPKSIVVPNDDPNAVTGTPLLRGQALPNYLLDDPMKSKELELVDFRTALAALAEPKHAKKNRERIWPVDLDDYITDQSTDPGEVEAMNTVKGKSKIKFDLTILAAANGAAKEPVYLYIIDDKERNKMMVVGPEEISSQLASEMKKNGLDYVVKTDNGSIQKINDFLAEGAKVRGENGKLSSGSTQNVIEGLIKAFSALCELAEAEAGDDPNQLTVEKGSTLGQVIHKSKSRPAVYTSIMKPRAATR